jgi:hypothetical protein
MTGLIKRMVAHKRIAEAEQQDRARFLAQAKGDPGPQGEAGKKGPKGDKGEPGKDGGIIVISRGGGSSGTDLATLTPGSESTEPTGIVVFQAGKPVSLPWAAFLALVGTSDDTHSRRVDFVGDALLYRGEAAPGTDDAAAAWRVRRIEFGPDGSVTEKWAAGNADFANAWVNRAALVYA